MTAVEVCPICDIAGCRHIRERATPTAQLSAALAVPEGGVSDEDFPDPLLDECRFEDGYTTLAEALAVPEVAALVAAATKTAICIAYFMAHEARYSDLEREVVKLRAALAAMKGPQT